MIDDQLGWYYWVDLGWVIFGIGDGIVQVGQIDQCGLVENVMVDYVCWILWEIQVLVVFDQLVQ